jgi:hypothetical protein
VQLAYVSKLADNSIGSKKAEITELGTSQMAEISPDYRSLGILANVPILLHFDIAVLWEIPSQAAPI